MEMDIEVVSLIVSASIPLILFYFGRKIQDYQNVIERRHKPRIQFDLEMNLFGPQGEYYLAEIFAVLQNKGLVEKEFHQITLEVLGVEKESEIELFVKTTLKDEKEEDKKKEKENTIIKGKKANKDALVGFPEIIVKSNFLNPSKKTDKYLVEPGVVQKVSYVARIPVNLSFVLVRASFNYHSKSLHQAQRLFKLTSNAL